MHFDKFASTNPYPKLTDSPSPCSFDHIKSGMCPPEHDPTPEHNPSPTVDVGEVFTQKLVHLCLFRWTFGRNEGHGPGC